jgi:hypothetical protein
MIANGVENAPSGKLGEGFGAEGLRLDVVVCKDEKFGLETSDFFEIELRPTLRRVHDGIGTSVAEGVGDEGVFANGDERLGPDNEEHVTAGKWRDATGSIGETLLETLDEDRAGVGRAEKISETLGGGDDLIDGVRIGGGVGRDAETGEGSDGFQAIGKLGDENQVRTKSGDGFEAGIDDGTHFGFALSVGGIVAVVGVADEKVLKT